MDQTTYSRRPQPFPYLLLSFHIFYSLPSMSARVVTAVADDGRVVAEKRSRHEADAVRLRHEAEVLSSARHPGIVEVVTCEPDAGDVVLRTEFVGGHSLDTVGPLELERAAGLVAAL